MRVDSVTLANFKCFEERTIELSSSFNLIVGDNGKGKTSILDGLAVALGSVFLGFPSPAKQRGIHRDDVRGQFFTQGEETTREKQFPSIVVGRGEVFGKGGEWARELTYEDGKTTYQNASWIKRLAEEQNKKVKAGGSNVLPVIAYYGTGRLGVQIRNRKVKTTGPKSRLMGYLDCLNPASDEKRLIEWFKTKEMAVLQKGQNDHEYTNPTLEACRKAIVSCVPDAANVYFDIGEDRLMLEMDNGKLTPFYHLSDGYRNTLAMVADIAVRAATLNPALNSHAIEETPGVVLIDEIDLHLHPKWQKQVVEDLRAAFPKIQFVATTHSPFVIQSLRQTEGVSLLNLDDPEADDFSGLSVEDIAEDVQKLDIPQRSHRWLKMKEAAEEFYAVLRQSKNAKGGKLETLKARLDELSMPFSDDPAYQALLHSERTAAKIDGEGDE